MDFIVNFNFTDLLTWEILFAIVLGTLYGIVVGAIPGLGTTIGLAMALPITYTMSPLAAVVLLATVYMACEYGGSISAILLGVPGTAAATATLLDGATMAKKGKPGTALAYSLVGALVGGLISIIILMVLSKPLANLAINFSDPEFALLGILGLLCVSGLSSIDLNKSIISLLMGLLLSTVGLDMLSGENRFTFGSINLMDGISMVALLIGMFAISEVFSLLGSDSHMRFVHDKKNLKIKLTREEFNGVRKTMIKSSFLGTLIGILPGLGPSAASWIAYTEEKRSAKDKENFGKGDPRGIAAPETANNAVVGGALIPLVALGIPGSPATAIILGAFLIHGIIPGPSAFNEQPNLMYGIFWGLFFANFAIYFIGKYTTSHMARVLTLPIYILNTTIIFMSLIGVYATDINVFHIWIAIVAGIVAFILNKLDFSLPSMVLAFVLGPIIEESIRRSLIISRGNIDIFYTRPVSIVLILIILGFITFLIVQKVKSKPANDTADKIDLETNKDAKL